MSLAPTPAPTLLRGPPRALTLGAVALVSLWAFEAMAVATAMPVVAAALDGLAAYALAFGLPMATSVVGMVLSGAWCDARGPAAAMRTGVAAFVAGLLLAGLAPTMGALVVGRGLQGLGSGLLIVALYVVVGHVVEPALRPRMFAAFAAAWVLPSVVGPPLAGVIVEQLGWRWVFLAAAVLAVPAALLVEPALAGLGRRDRVPGSAHRRIGWAVAAAVGAAGLHQAGQGRSGPGWGSVAVVLGIGALVAVVVAVPRLLPAGTVAARAGLPAVVLLRGLVASAFFCAEVFVPLLLVRERGLPLTAAGLVLTVAALTWSAGSWYQGRDGAPSRTALLRLGTAAIGVGVLAAASLTAAAVPIAVGVVGWGVAGLGMGLVYPTLSVLTLELSPPERQGTNSSALQIADAMFAAVTLALSGALFAALVDSGAVAYLAGFAVAGVLALLAVLVAGRARAGS